jgi:hypothetical protein
MIIAPIPPRRGSIPDAHDKSATRLGLPADTNSSASRDAVAPAVYSELDERFAHRNRGELTRQSLHQQLGALLAPAILGHPRVSEIVTYLKRPDLAEHGAARSQLLAAEVSAPIFITRFGLAYETNHKDLVHLSHAPWLEPCLKAAQSSEGGIHADELLHHLDHLHPRLRLQTRSMAQRDRNCLSQRWTDTPDGRLVSAIALAALSFFGAAVAQTPLEVGRTKQCVGQTTGLILMGVALGLGAELVMGWYRHDLSTCAGVCAGTTEQRMATYRGSQDIDFWTHVGREMAMTSGVAGAPERDVPLVSTATSDRDRSVDGLAPAERDDGDFVVV